MAINCRINRNISLNQVNEDGSMSSCNSVDITMGIGGIRTPIYVYNVDEVENLKFENDNRADDSLTVDTIITDAAFYSIDFTSASYDEEYKDGKWSHSLSLEIGNITSLFEDLLSDSVSGRYLVAFRPNGSNDYRMFGWKGGANLKYSMNVSDDSQGYTVQLEDESEYPLFTVYSDNFNVRNKFYSPIFKPLYNVAYCEQENGVNNGWSVAMYTVKVNSAGQALDRNNMLAQWSGLKQDAYKLNTVTSDGGYNILGTYDATATIEGHAVRVQDYDICPSDVSGTIKANNNIVRLNSTTTSSTVTITSDNEWTMVSNPQYSNVYPINGASGTTTLTISHNGVGGIDYIVLQNKITRERYTITVFINLIKVNENITLQNGTTSYVITPTVEGESSDYTFSVSPSVSATKGSDNYINVTFPTSSNEQKYTFTLVHANDSNERKTVTITILGSNADPSWQLLSSFCEIG